MKSFDEQRAAVERIFAADAAKRQLDYESKRELDRPIYRESDRRLANNQSQRRNTIQEEPSECW
jgi:hypothetical protein